MAPPLPTLFVSLGLACAFSLSMSVALARQAPSTSSERTLEVRLQEEGSIDCWNSLFQLRACTGELFLFFMNSEAYLGPSCCRAIRVMHHNCWPTMLLSLGFTSEEGDKLKDYCDGNDDEPDSRPQPPPAPSQAPLGPTTASPIYAAAAAASAP